jgi:hypothetical protein
VVDLEERRQLEHKKRIRIGYLMALFCAILWGLWYLPGNALWSLEPFASMFAAVDATHGGTVALIVVAVLISAFNALTVIIALFI